MSDYLGHFSLWGDFEPDHVTAALGLQPSSVYPKGYRFDETETASAVATWDLHCPPDLDMKEQMDFLLSVLWPCLSELRTWSKRYKAAINLSSEEPQVFSVSTEDMQRLVSLNVSLNCFYNNPENQDGN